MSLAKKQVFKVSAVVAAFTMIGGPVIRAQSSPARISKFEVASIKPCAGSSGGGRNGGGGSPGGLSPGRLTLNCLSVMAFIRMAYLEFEDDKPSSPESMGRMIFLPPIEGGPAWINSDLYTIEAKAEGTPGDGVMRGAMMRALLEDRFQLKIHVQTREIPVYTLTAAKGGIKMPRAQYGSCTPLDITRFPPPEFGPGKRYCRTNLNQKKGPNVTVDIEAMTLDDFCKTTLMFMDRRVVNKTGIPGLFNFQMVYAPDETSSPAYRNGRGVSDQPTDDAPAPSIFTALQDLGLKLEPAKGTGEFPVIDSVEKPSVN